MNESKKMTVNIHSYIILIQHREKWSIVLSGGRYTIRLFRSS